ncbi:hypothetical protein AYI70_g5120 [Smittium culicis]|uniref:Uncharacterized protein n=1 Tax=Smittium culicis TaxID=133412 RepID=A0A1R1XW29_9FUNG|nr:hypothetical protein AYI70_g5120 [Smittium culicis]
MNVSLTAVGLMWNINDYLIAFNTISTSNSSELSPKSSVRSESMDPVEASQLCLASANSIDNSPVSGLLETFLTEKNILFNLNNTKLWNYFLKLDLGNSLNSENSQILFLLVLHSLCIISTDTRHELRSSSVQTLFSTLDIYSDHLSVWCWDAVLWSIITPIVAQVSVCRTESLVSDWAISDSTLNYNKDLGSTNNTTLAENEINGNKSNSTNPQISLTQSLPEPQNRVEPEISKSGLFVENPKIVRLKTWDETLLTLMSKISSIWLNKFDTVLVKTSNPVESLISFLSWKVVILSGCHKPSKLYTLVFNHLYEAEVFTKTSITKNISKNSNHEDIPETEIYESGLFYNNIVSNTGINSNFPVSIGSSLIDSILDSINNMTKAFGLKTIALSETKSHNFGLYFWKTISIISQMSSDSKFIKIIRDSTKVIDNSIRSGFTAKNYIFISDAPLMLLPIVGPSGTNSLVLEDYTTLISTLKKLIFSEFNLEIQDINSMSQLQSSVLKNIDYIIELFIDNKHSPSYSDIIGRFKSQNRNTNSILSDRILLVSNILPYCLEFLSDMSILPIINLLYSESSIPGSFSYPTEIPSWAVSTLEASRASSIKSGFQFFGADSSENNNKPFSRITAKWKPTYIALSYKSTQSINSLISKLNLLEILDNDITREHLEIEALNSLELKKNCLDLEQGFEGLIAFAKENNYSLEFVFLLKNMIFQNTLDKMISSSAIFLSCWDCFEWNLLTSYTKSNGPNNSSPYSVLHPLWKIFSQTLPMAINYSFETLSIMHGFNIQKSVHKTWFLINQVIENSLFLPDSILKNWENAEKNSKHSLAKFRNNSSIINHFDKSDEKYISPQLSCNYSFRDIEFLSRNTLILRCPPPISSLNAYKNNNKDKTNEEEKQPTENVAKDNLHGFFIKTLNSSAIATLRFISSITDLVGEEKVIESAMHFDKNKNCQASFDVTNGNTSTIQAKDISSHSKYSNERSTHYISDSQAYSVHVDKFFNLIYRISKINCSPLTSRAPNLGLNKITPVSQEDLIAPYKSTKIYSENISLSLTALHWLFVSTSQESSVISSPLLPNNTDINSYKQFNKSSNLFFDKNKLHEQIYDSTNCLKINLKPECFASELDSEFSFSENLNTSHSTQKSSICNIGPIPKFSERPQISFWVSEIATKYLLIVSFDLMNDFLGSDSRYFIGISDSKTRARKHTKNFVFDTDIQLLFLISHLYTLNCRYNILAYKTDLSEINSTSEVLELIINSYDNSEINTTTRFEYLHSINKKLEESKSSIQDSLELKKIKDAENLSNGNLNNKVDDSISGLNIADISIGDKDNQGIIANKNSKLFNKNELYHRLLSSPFSHLFVLFDLISVLSTFDDTIGNLASKCKERIINSFF